MVSNYTNFQGGVMSRGVPAEAGGVEVFSPFGNIYFVDSGHPNANNSNSGKKPSQPLATIDAAINLCTASQGDVIIVAAGHAESVANATTIIPDIAGVSIIGLGSGANRPTITLTNAAGNIPISGANCRFWNFLITTSGTIDVTSAITVTGADAHLRDIEVRDSAATSQIIVAVTLSTGADRARIERLVGRSHASGDAATAGIACAVALDGVDIIDANLDGLYSNGCIYNVTTAMTNLSVIRGRLRNRHATQDGGVNVVATTTGWIIDATIRTATNDADGFNLAIVAADMQVYNPLIVNLDGERGGAWGTASAAA